MKLRVSTGRKEKGIIMKEYQRKKNNPYWLPKQIYMQALWKIRDYYRIKAEMDDVITEHKSDPDGMPKKNEISDPVFKKAMKRDKLGRQAKMIENSLLVIPKEYRRGVWEQIQQNKRYPNDADRHTYGKYKAMYIHEVAKSFGMI